MKRPRMIITALALALSLAMGGRAMAQDFSVSVPVDLNNIPPEITAVILQCVAICQDFGNIPGFQGISGVFDPETVFLGQTATVGTGRQVRSINPDTGEFHETVTVGFSSDAQHAPNNVGAYACWMKLRDSEGTEAYPNGNFAPNIFRSFNNPLEQPEVISRPFNFITGDEFINPALVRSGQVGSCEQ